jgi:hypothetical protein
VRQRDRGEPSGRPAVSGFATSQDPERQRAARSPGTTSGRRIMGHRDPWRPRQRPIADEMSWSGGRSPESTSSQWTWSSRAIRTIASTPGPRGGGPETGQVSYPRNLRYPAYIVSRSGATEALEALRGRWEQTSPVLNFVAQRQGTSRTGWSSTPGSAATPPARLARSGPAGLPGGEACAAARAPEAGSAGPRSSPHSVRTSVSRAAPASATCGQGPGRFQFFHDNSRDFPASISDRPSKSTRSA